MNPLHRRLSFVGKLLGTLALAVVSASAAITPNGSTSWPRTAAPGTYNASASSKLVVVVSGEHNFANNFTGNCSAVTYNGQPLIRAVNQAPASPASGGHGQTHSSIWYLDNPGNFSGAGTIAVTCTGTSWVATAIGLSGTLPGVGSTIAVSGAASAGIATNTYGSLVIAACGMGGQGNTASPLPGVTATIPSQATAIAGLVVGSNWAGHAVASASIAMPSVQTLAFNTAKTDVVTVAAAFADADPVLPPGPTPVVTDIIPGQSVGLAWSNFLPNSGTNVWVDVWIGNSPSNLQLLISANPAGLNLTSTTFTAPVPGIYHGRIDSYLQGSSSGTPFMGTPFSFEVSTAGLRAETWLGLRSLPSLQLLQREGIAMRPPDQSLRLNSSSLVMPVPCGVRLRGLFTPEATGLHTFHIAGSENAALWLSSNDSRFNKQRIAWLLNASDIAQWNRSPTQTSIPLQLSAGVSYYIEAQVMNSIGGGHVEIGWTPPGATAPALMPIARLSCPPAESADFNDNNLPDGWEASKGLSNSSLPGALAEFGDPDNDGISNFDEFKLNSNPLVKDALADGLTRDTWTNVLDGYWISDFTSNRAVSLNYPNETTQVSSINDNARGAYYVSRYRGFITAPTTGAYRFWIAGNKKCELWLADGTVKYPGTSTPLANRFGKQRIALNADPKTVSSNVRYDYDQYLEQRSRIVHLVQGQSYYIEVLHKQRENANVNHVAVAWQPPGQPRSLIPSTAFTSDVPDDTDGDGDFLPYSWENQYGLNPADSGVTDTRDGQYGDWDADGLTNLDEFQFGTDPKKADTDADGISDFNEIFRYGSDPRVANNLSPFLAAAPIPHQYASFTGGWTSNANGSLSAWDRRGEISYTFTLAQPGVHEVVLAGAAIGAIRAVERLPIVLSLDGNDPFARQELVSNNGAQGVIRCVTPWLTAGPHTLTILHDNYLAARRLRIDSIQFLRLGGLDLDQSGAPDWIEENAASANKLTRVPAESRTSPVSIEGVTENLGSVTVGYTPFGGTTPIPLIVQSSINDSFFTDVPLSPGGSTALNASFLGGLVNAPSSMTWIPTNLFAGFADSTLHIRKGDSLRIDSWSAGAPDGQPFTVALNGTLLADESLNTTHTSGQPFIATFGTAGTFTFTATHAGQTTTVTLQVHSADFGPSHSVRAYSPRTMTPPLLSPFHLVEADERLIFQETTANPQSGPRTFAANVTEAGDRHVIARLPAFVDGAPSAIVTRGTIRGFSHYTTIFKMS
jgi:PA14 domain